MNTAQHSSLHVNCSLVVVKFRYQWHPWHIPITAIWGQSDNIQRETPWSCTDTSRLLSYCFLCWNLRQKRNCQYKYLFTKDNALFKMKKTYVYYYLDVKLSFLVDAESWTKKIHSWSYCLPQYCLFMLQSTHAYRISNNHDTPNIQNYLSSSSLLLTKCIRCSFTVWRCLSPQRSRWNT